MNICLVCDYVQDSPLKDGLCVYCVDYNDSVENNPAEDGNLVSDSPCAPEDDEAAKAARANRPFALVPEYVKSKSES